LGDDDVFAGGNGGPSREGIGDAVCDMEAFEVYRLGPGVVDLYELKELIIPLGSGRVVVDFVNDEVGQFHLFKNGRARQGPDQRHVVQSVGLACLRPVEDLPALLRHSFQGHGNVLEVGAGEVAAWYWHIGRQHVAAAVDLDGQIGRAGEAQVAI